MERTNALLHDSHVAYWGIPRSGEQRYWDVYIGRVGDDVRIVLAMDGFEEYLNRRVTSVDGIPADSLLRMSAQYIGGYDAAVEEYLKCTQFGTLMWSYIDYRPDTLRRRCLAPCRGPYMERRKVEILAFAPRLSVGQPHG